MPQSPTTPIVEFRNVSVVFPGVVALKDVDFRLYPGEIHSLMGENGAGKSTLIKVLTGALRADAGEVLVDGRVTRFTSPGDALRAGVSTVYQEFRLLENLSVAENVMLGREPHRFGAIDRRSMRRRATAILEDLGVSIDPRATLGAQTMATRQLVAIARALAVDATVLVLDEPTSSLENDEVTELFRVLRVLKERGVAILFVSHFIEQVYEIADRITVLRDGRVTGCYATDAFLRTEELASLLAPRDGEGVHGHGEADDAYAPLVRLHGLRRRPHVEPTDLDIYAGEVLGVAGLLGSGRTELARLLGGVDRPDAGGIEVDARAVRIDSPRRGIRAGVVYATEDRRSEGILPHLSVAENIGLALQSDRGWHRPIGREALLELAESYIEELRIRPADPHAPAGSLSGGNQQKVLLARWLAVAPRLLVLDEPTRGVDMGARAEIHRIVDGLAAGGMAVVYISGDIEEVLRVSDRVAIMREGEIVAVAANADLTVESVLATITYAQPRSEPVAPTRDALPVRSAG